MESPLVRPELPALGFVANLEEDDRRLLSSYGTFLLLKASQEVIRTGDCQDSLYLVIVGALHALAAPEDQSVPLGEIGAGESFGEINIFDPAEASATVTSVGLSQVWKISRTELGEFLGANPTAAAHLLIAIATQLSRRLRQTNQRLIDARVGIARDRPA